MFVYIDLIYRCREVMKNLEMWVEIINEQGNCVPVEETKPKTGGDKETIAKTGGVYAIQKVASY